MSKTSRLRNEVETYLHENNTANTSSTNFFSLELVLFRLEKVTILHGSSFFL